MPNEPGDTMSSVWVRSEIADRIADTPDLSRPWCPLCEPIETIDPLKDFVRVQYCGSNGHHGLPEGAADNDMSQQMREGYLSGTSESTGASNRVIANLIRGETDETEATDLQTPEEA